MRPNLKRIPPAVFLFVISPVFAELLSCYLPPATFFNPLILLITLPPYGCGVLIARELKVRFACGWISLLWFGLAFGLFFEGIVTRVLFNPDWEGLGDLVDYVHVFGFNWTHAAGIVHFQAIMAILCPILLAELVFPQRRHESWISSRVLAACCVVLPAWTFVLWLFVRYIPPLPGAGLLLCVTAGLIIAGLNVPKTRSDAGCRPRAAPFVFGLIGGVGMTAIMFSVFVLPTFEVRPPMPVLLALVLGLAAVEFVLLAHLSGGDAWTDRHQFATVVGVLAPFLIFGVMSDLETFSGRSIVGALTVWQFWRLRKSITDRNAPSPAIPESGVT